MKHLLLIISILFLTINTKAQSIKTISTTDLVAECSKTNGELPDKQFVIWFPPIFWEIIADKMNVSSEYITEPLKDYMMFCVVDYSLVNGKIIFKSEEDIRESLMLIDSSDNKTRPVDESEISGKADSVLNLIRPVMKQLLGQFGEGMKVFLFKPKHKKLHQLDDVKSKNKFSLRWDSNTITWKLPFSSVLPPKICPIDKEKMKGNWDYCPFHGVKLEK